MYQLLKQIAKTGIVSESPPQPDETLRQIARDAAGNDLVHEVAMAEQLAL